MIESHLNNIPYKSDSLMTPSSLINPKQLARYYLIPQSRPYYYTKIGELTRHLNDIRVAQLLEDSKLQAKCQKIREPKLNQTVWYFKNEDQKQMGTLFGVINSKIGSDFLVDLSKGGQEKVSAERLNLIYDKNNEITETE